MPASWSFAASRTRKLPLFQTLSDPPQAERNTFDAVTRISHQDLEIVRKSGLSYFVRNRSTTLESRLIDLEKHFGLS